MNAEDALVTIAEMAIGVAGFSAIVGAFSSDRSLSISDRRRFVWLFTNAFAAAFLAFVPVLLSELFSSEFNLWRYSSAAMAIVWGFAAAAWIFDELRQDRATRSAPKGFWQGPAALVPSFLNAVLQLVNASGLFWEPAATAYTAGTLVWLYCAAITFASMVLERPTA